MISVVCLFWSFLIQASDKYYEYVKGKEKTTAEAANYIRNKVDECVVSVCNNKYNTLIALISDIITKKVKPRYIVSKPGDQLKTITRELGMCLCTLLEHDGYKLNENDMYVSIFYKFHTQEHWEQAQSTFPETGLDVSKVTGNPSSTFSQTMKSKNGVVFINDKQDGFIKKQYIPDQDDKYDEDGQLKGSILCYRIICKKNGIEYVTAVLSISTYTKKIEPSNLPDKIKNTQNNIVTYIVQPFEKRIKIELCLLYMETLYNNRKDQIVVSKCMEEES